MTAYVVDVMFLDINVDDRDGVWGVVESRTIGRSLVCPGVR